MLEGQSRYGRFHADMQRQPIIAIDRLEKRQRGPPVQRRSVSSSSIANPRFHMFHGLNTTNTMKACVLSFIREKKERPILLK